MTTKMKSQKQTLCPIQAKSQRKLTFSIKEKVNIHQGKILTDDKVNLDQNILAKQGPGILGFMNTYLEKMYQFEIYSAPSYWL